MTTATAPSSWVRVKRATPCPVCGGPKGCSVSGDGAVVVCIRQDAGASKTTRNGWAHRIGEGAVWNPNGVRTAVVPETLPSRHDLPRLVRRYQTAINPVRLARHADRLGVTVTGLRRLGIGWADDQRAWAFPMTDASGTVRGIRIRAEDGAKWSIKGGKEGLFVPSDLDLSRALLVVEGPTDTAALLDLGFSAVGRPSCTGGTSLLVSLVTERTPPMVVVVADRDEPGQRGAAALASELCAYTPQLRLVTPPAKDARAWVQAGATAADFRSLIRAARPVGLEVVNA